MYYTRSSGLEQQLFPNSEADPPRQRRGIPDPFRDPQGASGCRGYLPRAHGCGPRVERVREAVGDAESGYL